jgi:hypothetical protein
LGEADLLSGKLEPAIRNYQKSLELDSLNENARTMLKKFGR